MESVWEKTITIPQYNCLTSDLKTEAAVIGGGMAGILTAYFLQQQGVSVAVIEADRIASGQTKHTTAKVTSQHGLIYYKLIHQVGEEQAKQYAQANEAAIKEYKQLIEKEKIDCEWMETLAYLYSTQEEESLKKEERAARKLGIDAEFTVQTSLSFSVQSALKFYGQAQFHPLKFLSFLASKLTIYEQTRVLEVKEDKLITNRGVISAKHIIFATHYPFINVPGYYFMRMHQERSYVLALEKIKPLDGMYFGIDKDGLSFRSLPTDILLLGGGNHRTGENKEGGKYQSLLKAKETYYKKAKEIARWSAQDCMTLDNIPYIGRFSEQKPDWYVATGFEKWGMTSSMVSARIISNLILNQSAENAEVFSPQRVNAAASAKRFLEEGAHAVTGLTKRVFSLPSTQTSELPNGHGGIVEYNGEKLGVYKDKEGKIYTVSICCPHLGCQLEWNPDELSWDCPCHGSRFDYYGNLIDNPAQEGLSHE